MDDDEASLTNVRSDYVSTWRCIHESTYSLVVRHCYEYLDPHLYEVLYDSSNDPVCISLDLPAAGDFLKISVDIDLAEVSCQRRRQLVVTTIDATAYVIPLSGVRHTEVASSVHHERTIYGNNLPAEQRGVTRECRLEYYLLADYSAPSSTVDLGYATSPCWFNLSYYRTGAIPASESCSTIRGQP